MVNIWRMGTGSYTLEILEREPIQEVKLLHFPQAVLYAHNREADTPCAIDWSTSW